MIKQIMVPLEKEFGKLTYHEGDFTNTGVHHLMLPDGSVELDQDEYIAALKPIVHVDLVGASGDDDAPPHLVDLFWSLLGAVAYALITQFWIAVYVVALQRQAKAPKIIHVRRLNALVRVRQKRPARILYRAMDCCRLLECHADSGFSKEQESGYGIRGANFMRAGRERGTGRTVWHLLDGQCRSHKLVTRNSFSSETLAVVAASDDLIVLALTMHELVVGPASAAETRRMRDESVCKFKTILITDSMSLWSAIAVATVRVPSDKNLAIHFTGYASCWIRA